MLKIEIWKVDSLIPYVNNPRKNDHAVNQMAAIIKEFGFKVPMIIKQCGTIIDGHLRYKAAKKLNLDSVPVIISNDLSDAQIKALRIAINKSAELAQWDMELLQLELEQIKELEFDIEPLGFDFPKDGDFVPKFKDDEDNGPKKAEYRLIVTLPEEDEMQQLFDDLKSKGYKVKAG